MEMIKPTPMLVSDDKETWVIRLVFAVYPDDSCMAYDAKSESEFRKLLQNNVTIRPISWNFKIEIETIEKTRVFTEEKSYFITEDSEIKVWDILEAFDGCKYKVLSVKNGKYLLSEADDFYEFSEVYSLEELIDNGFKFCAKEQTKENISEPF